MINRIPFLSFPACAVASQFANMLPLLQKMKNVGGGKLD